MAEYVQWGSVPQGGNGEQSEYLKLKSGNKYRIRPNFWSCQILQILSTKIMADWEQRSVQTPDVCPVRDRHPDLKKPSMRYAAYVIDREDNKVKILEAPQSVFRPIGS